MNRKMLFLGILVLMSGCGQRIETAESVLVENEQKYVVTILVDMSGSFQHLMVNEGKGYKLVLQVIDRYFRDRIGEEDQLVIAQISGTDRALLWQGTPQQLRRDFPSASAFRDFLVSKSNPAGSFVHESMAASLEYMVSDPAVSSGKTRCALFVLSDMEDTRPKTAEIRKRVTAALTDFGAAKGIIGMYYVRSDLVSKWRNTLRKTGIADYRVEAEIVSRPTLPSFE